MTVTLSLSGDGTGLLVLTPVSSHRMVRARLHRLAAMLREPSTALVGWSR